MAIFGDNTNGADTFPSGDGRAILTRFTASEAGTINSAHVHFDASSGAGTSAKFVMHADSAGTPGALVYSTAAVAVPSGGGQIDFVLSGSFTATNYFLGYVCNGGDATSDGDATSAMETHMANGGYNYTTPGAWPGTDVEYPDHRVNAWIDYTAGGGGAANPKCVFGLALHGPFRRAVY